jgi:predicted transport protein
MILIYEGRKFTEEKYVYETDFENEVVKSHKSFFGEHTIYIDAKAKIKTGTLGNTIPDGFLFNMVDPENRELYLVEVELAGHDFYGHIFPQITKFFAFLKNNIRRKELAEKIFSMINTNPELKKQFKKYLGEKEVYKFLNDIIEESQNILIIIDGEKREFSEIMDTYSDTWGKMVKVVTLKKFTCENEMIFSVHPELDALEYSYQQATTQSASEQVEVSEEFHLEDVGENIRIIYQKVKERMLRINPGLIFNVAKYWISIRNKRAFAYIFIQKKKVRIVVMVKEELIQGKIKHHSIRKLSESVQNYYGGPCASIYIQNLDHVDEAIDLLKDAMEEFGS